jgi:hypothetical protein
MLTHVEVNEVKRVPKVFYNLFVYFFLVLLRNFKCYLSNAPMCLVYGKINVKNLHLL